MSLALFEIKGRRYKIEYAGLHLLRLTVVASLGITLRGAKRRRL